MSYLLKRLYALIGVFILLTSSASAFDDQWYVGVGGGASFLSPEPAADGFAALESEGSAFKLFLGRDLGRESSVQLEYSNFGEAPLVTAQNVTYQAVEGTIIYRLYDSRDRALSRSNMAFRLYGRFGLGYMLRDVEDDIALETASEVYFSPGLGAELLLNNWAGLRAEASYVDLDVWQANLGFVLRFGGSGNRVRSARPVTADTTLTPEDSPPAATPAPEPMTDPMAAPVTPPVPVADTDNDGVADNVDQCAASRPGYPVQDSGCPLLNGVLSGVRFAPGTADLMPASFAQLNYLASVLKEYPQAQIQLLAHTDTNRTPQQQSILTRGRLRTLGTYLVRQGISANRLVLRSLGGSKPVAANDSAAGRAANNRIEVLER